MTASPTPGKVFVLTTDFKPMVGGIASYLHNLWHEIGKQRSVKVLTTVEIGNAIWDRSYELESLPRLPQRMLGHRLGDTVPPLRKFNTTLYYQRLARYADTMIAGLLREAAETTQVFVGHWSPATHFWCRALESAGIPYSLFCYGMDIVIPLDPRSSEWRRADFVAAQQVIGCSSATAELSRKRLGADVRAFGLAPGVEPKPEIPNDHQRAQHLRAELQLRGGPVLLTVGRLVERKGLELVLRCLPELAAAFPETRYVIAGEGPHRPALQSMARQFGVEDCVRFLGPVDEATKWILYTLCDLFVMPNRLMGGTDWEGFGIVFLEAALCAKASVGGNNGGVPDAIVDGITGLLVDPEDPHALTAALASLLRDPEQRRRMGLAAQKRALRDFNWPAVASRFSERQRWAAPT